MKLGIALLLVLLAGCASAGPSAWGNPRTYLAEFPLGMRQSELYSRVGAPHAALRLGETEIWTYRVTESDIGPRYEFEIIGGVVTNITYRTTIGMYDGLNAQNARKQ
jgi:hypothetical protein